MARCVFFSFHYQRDIFRVNTVRNHFLTKGGYSISGYQDRSLWEKAKTSNPLALKRMINRALEGTTVTVVLIGAETADRPWVKYEIEKSLERGNGLLGIYIYNIRHAVTKQTDFKGKNPFDRYAIAQPSPSLHTVDVQRMASNLYPTYDWVLDRGYNNFSMWVEKAAKAAGK
ncbi:TIR domain-containing protein [Nodosilinea sp. PGN35]|uniref:TIR domain-containing protein n=1 Tax=Nodosilinea sp. PGN35 TaxID=3020489 RepID=UPI0023B28A33|nr:TIR domain-containing protein [Nodosilinea sp. TSF1-S3]MDF0366575.1 TIR domain-containing protein [Nodosilinea sp. TSF1-S3]